eukprot:gene26261-17363_t
MQRTKGEQFAIGYRVMNSVRGSLNSTPGTGTSPGSHSLPPGSCKFRHYAFAPVGTPCGTYSVSSDYAAPDGIQVLEAAKAALRSSDPSASSSSAMGAYRRGHSLSRTVTGRGDAHLLGASTMALLPAGPPADDMALSQTPPGRQTSKINEEEASVTPMATSSQQAPQQQLPPRVEKEETPSTCAGLGALPRAIPMNIKQARTRSVADMQVIYDFPDGLQAMPPASKQTNAKAEVGHDAADHDARLAPSSAPAGPRGMLGLALQHEAVQHQRQLEQQHLEGELCNDGGRQLPVSINLK